MSRTYRDKERWRAKNYYKNEPPEYEWFGPFRIFLGHNKKDLNEPEWRKIHKYYCVDNYGNYKWWRRWSHRRMRRKTKIMLSQGKYDLLPLKPENIDYIMC